MIRSQLRHRKPDFPSLSRCALIRYLAPQSGQVINTYRGVFTGAADAVGVFGASPEDGIWRRSSPQRPQRKIRV
jgi:hypothetical protein